VSEAWIDLNADLGEDPARAAEDSALMAIVSSANIACGGHAGDEATMRATLLAARSLDVAAGAHPSYPDRARFGRVEMEMSGSDVAACVAEQVGALHAVAMSVGSRVCHVKPHGALYHAAMNKEHIARAVVDGVRRAGAEVPLVGLAGGLGLEVWRTLGVAVISEAFADRRYKSDGSLRARINADALITDPDEAAAQAVLIATRHSALSQSGTSVPIAAQSICVHSDTPGAIACANAVRAALERAGVAVRSPQATHRP